MKKTFIILLTLINIIYVNAQDKDFIKVFNDTKKSFITYSMNHPLHSWTGTSKEVASVILTDKAKKQIQKVAVSIKITSFNSQNANRDSHAMEATEAIRFPLIKFASTSVQQDGNMLNVTGKLFFHGVTKQISFTAERDDKKDKIEITGGFVIKMTDFNIQPPTLMTIPTDDEIIIAFDMFY